MKALTWAPLLALLLDSPRSITQPGLDRPLQEGAPSPLHLPLTHRASSPTAVSFVDTELSPGRPPPPITFSHSTLFL